jgi:hypothetical protein
MSWLITSIACAQNSSGQTEACPPSSKVRSRTRSLSEFGPAPIVRKIDAKRVSRDGFLLPR